MTDVRGARIVRLIQDPQLGGDLLLLAIGLSAVYDFGLEYEDGIHGIGGLLWSGGHDPHWKIRETFNRDVRTYRPPTGYSLSTCVRMCTGPMLRRDNLCRRNATTWGYLTDWATGEKVYIGACSRHYSWFDAESIANRGAKPDLVPLPHANHGGLLVNHFPRIDWPRFWRDLDPKWVEHPERVERPKPDLALVIGTGLGDGQRGPLALVPTGGAS